MMRLAAAHAIDKKLLVDRLLTRLRRADLHAADSRIHAYDTSIDVTSIRNSP
jgi:hypothetical protein